MNLHISLLLIFTVTGGGLSQRNEMIKPRWSNLLSAYDQRVTAQGIAEHAEDPKKNQTMGKELRTEKREQLETLGEKKAEKYRLG